MWRSYKRPGLLWALASFIHSKAQARRGCARWSAEVWWAESTSRSHRTAPHRTAPHRNSRRRRRVTEPSRAVPSRDSVVVFGCLQPHQPTKHTPRRLPHSHTTPHHTRPSSSTPRASPACLSTRLADSVLTRPRQIPRLRTHPLPTPTISPSSILYSYIATGQRTAYSHTERLLGAVCCSAAKPSLRRSRFCPCCKHRVITTASLLSSRSAI